MTIIFRDANLENAQELATIQAMLREYFSDIAIPSDDPKTSFIEEIATLYQPPNVALVAVMDTHIAGCVFLKEIDQEYAEIQQLYVSHAARGKNIGQQLLEVLILRGFRTYQYLRLDTKHDLEPAIALYRKLGFYEIERYNNNPFAQLFFELDKSSRQFSKRDCPKVV